MSQKPIIALHLGVHKTATTYLQSKLNNSTGELTKNGISYIPLGRLRRTVTSQLDETDFSNQQLMDALKPYLNCQRLILSDENLIGGMFKPKANFIYDDVARRLKKLLSLLDNYSVEIFITLRNYPEYFVSRYTESLRHYDFFSFEQYYDCVDFTTVSWLDVIDSIKSVYSGNITVTDYNDFLNDEKNYFYSLLKKDNVNLKNAENNPTIRRARLSKEAYEIVNCFGSQYSKTSIKKLINFLENTPQDNPATQFMPFTPLEIHAFSERYAREMSLLNPFNANNG